MERCCQFDNYSRNRSPSWIVTGQLFLAFLKVLRNWRFAETQPDDRECHSVPRDSLAGVYGWMDSFAQ
jgi:hypothetical protein